MPTTSNFGWTTPADTDLVKDGAAAIRTLGNGIDTSLVDLKGGTTGQVLAKASNTDLDFTWTNGGDITEVTAGTGLSGGGTSGAVTLTNTVATTFDAKGDLVVGTGADTFAKLTVGTNGHTLVADSSTSTGLKWEAPASASGPAFRATMSASQTDLALNTAIKVNFNTEDFDTDSCYNTTNYRFTPNKAGYYLIGLSLELSQGSSAYCYARIYKNGNDYRTVFQQTNNVAMFVSDLVYFNGSTDYVEAFAQFGGNATRTLNTTAVFFGSFERS